MFRTAYSVNVWQEKTPLSDISARANEGEAPLPQEPGFSAVKLPKLLINGMCVCPKRASCAPEKCAAFRKAVRSDFTEYL